MSNDENTVIDMLGNNAQAQLKSFIERLERLEEDKSEIVADMKSVFMEAKGNGFDTKIMRKVIRLRKQDKARAAEEQALVDLYMHTIEALFG